MDLAYIFTILTISFISTTETATYTNVTMLRTSLLANYDKYVRPKNNQSEPTHISMKMTLKSITNLDQINGVLTTVGGIAIEWIDEKLNWNPSDHGDIHFIKMNDNLIWVPDIVLSNAAKKLEKLGLPIMEANVHHTGLVHYVLGDVMYTTCDVDVTSFPFDTQYCFLEFLPFAYSTWEVKIISNPVDLGIYSENNAWVLKSTSSETMLIDTDTVPYMKVTLTLERRYAFFIVSLFFPVIILAVLNGMVFVLPADSGERVGYAITCLLSMSVYLTFASEILPTSSKPVAVVIYIMLFVMLLSAAICFGTIIGLRFHRYGEMAAHPYVLKLCGISNKKSQVEQSPDMENFEKCEPEQERVTWADIAKLFDKICFIASNVLVFLLTFIFILIVRLQI